MNHLKKMIAPVIIAVLFFIYLGIYVALILRIPELNPVKLLLAVPLVLLGAGMLYVLIARIREIRSGEEDDLSNY